MYMYMLYNTNTLEFYMYNVHVHIHVFVPSLLSFNSIYFCWYKYNNILWCIIHCTCSHYVVIDYTCTCICKCNIHYTHYIHIHVHVDNTDTCLVMFFPMNVLCINHINDMMHLNYVCKYTMYIDCLFYCLGYFSTFKYLSINIPSPFCWVYLQSW